MKALAVIRHIRGHSLPVATLLMAALMFAPGPATAACRYLPAAEPLGPDVLEGVFVRRRGRTAALYDFEVDGAVRSYPCPICPFYPPGLDRGKKVQFAVREGRIVEMGEEHGCQADESRLWFYRIKRFAGVLAMAVVVLLLSKIFPRKR